MSIIQSGVFERRGAVDTVSSNVYNLVLGAVVAWGLMLNWAMVENLNFEQIRAINPIVFFVGYLVSCIAGVIIISKSDTPMISFLGYNMIAVPFGFILCLALPAYQTDTIIQAVQTTAFVTVAMMVLSSMQPKFFLSIGPALFWALLISIVVELVQFFIFKVEVGIMDWIVAAIFCGYIGYDWARANSIPKTIDNAVDSAASIYMDIINLFIRILEIMGRNK